MHALCSHLYVSVYVIFSTIYMYVYVVYIYIYIYIYIFFVLSKMTPELGMHGASVKSALVLDSLLCPCYAPATADQLFDSAGNMHNRQ